MYLIRLISFACLASFCSRVFFCFMPPWQRSFWSLYNVFIRHTTIGVGPHVCPKIHLIALSVEAKIVVYDSWLSFLTLTALHASGIFLNASLTRNIVQNLDARRSITCWRSAGIMSSGPSALNGLPHLISLMCTRLDAGRLGCVAYYFRS